MVEEIFKFLVLCQIVGGCAAYEEVNSSPREG